MNQERNALSGTNLLEDARGRHAFIFNKHSNLTQAIIVLKNIRVNLKEELGATNQRDLSSLAMLGHKGTERPDRLCETDNKPLFSLVDERHVALDVELDSHGGGGKREVDALCDLIAGAANARGVNPDTMQSQLEGRLALLMDG